MGDKAKYILYTILDFSLSWGGSAAVIVLNFISKDTSTGYKISFGGLVLIIALVLTAKALFEKHYRDKMDTYLQQLAEATTQEQKTAVSEALNKHKMKNDIYQRLIILLPFGILYLVTYFGAEALLNLRNTVGLVLASMSAGSVFNIIKKPLGEKVSFQKLTKNVEKK